MAIATSQIDSLGDETAWTYNTDNQVLTQTKYLTAATAGVAASTPENHQLCPIAPTARIIFDYTVSPLDEVTQYNYARSGQSGLVISEVRFATTYNTTTYGSITNADLGNFAAANSAGAEITNYLYLYRCPDS